METGAKIEEELGALGAALERLGGRVADAAALVGLLDDAGQRIDRLAVRAEEVEDADLRRPSSWRRRSCADSWTRRGPGPGSCSGGG